MASGDLRGFCYIRILSAYNDIEPGTFDILRARKILGRFPLLREVVSYVFGRVESDFYMPNIRLVAPRLFHVDKSGTPVLFSTCVSVGMFSQARVGGLGDAEERIVRVNNSVAMFSRLCENGGFDFATALTEASRKHAVDIFKEPAGELKQIFKPLVETKLKGKDNFIVNYDLTALQIATLQREFAELNVVVTGKQKHPHAMSAATRACCEALILKKVGYKRWVKSLTHNSKFFLVDVGGNYVRHVRMQRRNVHCCTPILDFKDSARETERISVMRSMLADKTISHATYSDYICKFNNLSPRCRDRAEFCKITATYGMLLHSQYDIPFSDLGKIFDNHEFEIVWSVINFDLSIFYRDKGVITDQGVNFVKRDNKIVFNFVGDASMSYTHDLNDYMRILYEQILVTPKGRVFLIERTDLRCGNLFIKFVYCKVAPESKSLKASFSYWSEKFNDRVIIATWEYCDDFFCESKFKTSAQPIVSFKRKFIEVDRRFRDLLYGHCLRSGDKSFNLNEIFSAALTFNTRMTINGNDIRSMNRVVSTDLMDVVVAIYCIAYRERYIAGKKIERFVNDERDRRGARRLGLTDFLKCSFKYVFSCPTLLESCMDVWNNMVEALAKVRARSVLDADFFESVRCVEIEEFAEVTGEYETDLQVLLSLDVDEVEAQVVDGVLNNIVKYVRRTSAVQGIEKSLNEESRPVEEKIEKEMVNETFTSEREKAESTNTLVSAKSRRKVIAKFHKACSIQSAATAQRFRQARKVRQDCDAKFLVAMPADGHCVFWALGYPLKMDALEMRESLYAAMNECERERMRYVLITDGSLEGQGTCDLIPVYERTYKISVCVHVRSDGVECVTTAYGSGVEYEKVLHLMWTVCGDSGHVDVLLMESDREISEAEDLLLDDCDATESVSEFEELDDIMSESDRMSPREEFGDSDLDCVSLREPERTIEEIISNLEVVDEECETATLSGENDNLDERTLCGSNSRISNYKKIGWYEFLHIYSMSEVLNNFMLEVPEFVITDDVSLEKMFNERGATDVDFKFEQGRKSRLIVLMDLDISVAETVGVLQGLDVLEEGTTVVCKYKNYFEIEKGYKSNFKEVIYYKPFFSTETDPEVYVVLRSYLLAAKAREEDEVETVLNDSDVKGSEPLDVNDMKNLLIPPLPLVNSMITKQRVQGTCWEEVYVKLRGRMFENSWESSPGFLKDLKLLFINNTSLKFDKFGSMLNKVTDKHLTEWLGKYLSERGRFNRSFNKFIRLSEKPQFDFSSKDQIIATKRPTAFPVSNGILSLGRELRPIVDRNLAVEMARPGHRRVCLSGQEMTCKSYGKESVTKVRFDGCAANNDRRLKDVSGSKVTMVGMNVDVKPIRMYMRTVSVDTSVNVVDIIKTEKRDSIRVISSVSVGVQCDFPETEKCVSPSEMSGRMSAESGRTSAGSDYEHRSVSSCSNRRSENDSGYAYSRTSSLSLSRMSIDVKRKKRSISSVLKSFVRVKEPVGEVTTDDVRSVLPLRDVDDPMIRVKMWTAFPDGLALSAYFYSSEDDRVWLIGGVKEFLCCSENVKKNELASRMFVVNGDWKGYYRLIGSVHVMLINTVSHPERCFRDFLKWLPAKVDRVALEFCPRFPVSVLGVYEAIVASQHKFTIFQKHTTAFNSLEKATSPVVQSCNAPPMVLPHASMNMRSPVYIEGDTARENYINAAIEYKHLLSVADSVNADDLKVVYDSFNTEMRVSAEVLASLEAKSLNLYDNVNKRWMVKEPTRTYMCGYAEDGYVSWNAKPKKFETSSKYVLVSRRTEVMLDAAILRNIEKIDLMSVRLPQITWVNGPPGCGKTTHIVNAYSHKDVILTMTCEGRDEVRERLSARKDLGITGVEDRVRTVASVLVNGGGESSEVDRVFVDEALMMHAGTILFLVELLRARELYMIGDVNQIPYVDRDHICSLYYYHPSKFSNITMVLNCSYRCPLDVIYSLSYKYPGICGISKVTKSMEIKSYSENVTCIPKSENTLYLVHFQSDKDSLLREGYAKLKGSKVLTIHEAQGLTFQHTILIRTKSKPLLLYDKVEYSIVAISRHTKSFVYFTDASDATSSLINRSFDMSGKDLEEWNALQKVRKAGGNLYFPSERMLLPDPHRYGFEDALLNIPHSTHPSMVPVVVNAAISYELHEKPVITPGMSVDINYLQAWYDDKFMEAVCLEYSMDQVMVEMEDIDLFAESLVVDPTRGIVKEKKFGNLRPLLRTMMPADRKASQRESLLGAVKRNLNAPVLINEKLSPRAMAEFIVENFVNSVVPDESRAMFDSFEENPVELNPQLVDQWLNKQPPSVRKTACSDVPLHLRPFNQYSYMIKNKIKPPLEISASLKYASVQTIAYYAKSLNVVFCPVFNVLMERLLTVITRKIMIFTGVSNSDFEIEINRRLNSFIMDRLAQVENDMSKYDKAQGEVLRLCEDMILKKLGMPDDLLEIWSNSHVRSRLRDSKTGVSFDTDYQRKSGDASTFFGNTLVLLIVLVACYDIDTIELILAAGDDSLIYFKEGYFIDYDPSPIMADLFNLECKLMTKYSIPYFCSKFLIVTEKWIHFVPDPVKFLTKLGRRDMANYEHVEDYRISCLDVMTPLFNLETVDKLSIGVKERYGGEINDCSKLISILSTICSSKIKFSQMFAHDSGVILCYDPTRRKLD